LVCPTFLADLGLQGGGWTPSPRNFFQNSKEINNLELDI